MIYIRSEDGFTLLEMLLVLFVVSLLSGLAYVNLIPLYEGKKAEQFFEQLNEDILFMQELAMSTSERTNLQWFPQSHRYIIQQTYEEGPLLSRYYDKKIRVDLHTFPSIMTYSGKGNINRGGTIYVYYKQKTYKIVFQLGKGRFYYNEI
ncbi:competence type IV pilus minor pilin ComGD [Bacillus sp. 165]|uniref:competence type IV pilus minor pilin ComGD n=1 Tax=Bacillus sp. 165 TaxID=1529117 RepID=UPI001ADC4B87|nr:competence type IV pilus minor pilin ComGD [Bacillus sp. 165]MBO9129667.1 prepilin-type N-terminal cleavage/methylation domain-containing protein [Bacillus sp. 165]